MWRPGPDGTMFHPHGGRKPGPPPKGFEVDPIDPRIAVPILAPCEHRELRVRESTCCGGNGKYFFCKALGSSIRATTCLACKGDKDWIAQCLLRS